MKGFVRSFLINLTAIHLSTSLVNSFTYEGGHQTLLLGGFIFMLINMIVKPIAKIFFLPINFVTMGLFSFVINALMLYLLTLLIPQFIIQPFFFPGYSANGFIIPPIRFSLIATYIIISIIISTITAFLHWIAK